MAHTDIRRQSRSWRRRRGEFRTARGRGDASSLCAQRHPLTISYWYPSSLLTRSPCSAQGMWPWLQRNDLDGGGGGGGGGEVNECQSKWLVVHSWQGKICPKKNLQETFASNSRGPQTDVGDHRLQPVLLPQPEAADLRSLCSDGWGTWYSSHFRLLYS